MSEKEPGIYMASEIKEQPEAVRRTLLEAKSEASLAAQYLLNRFIYTTGSGSSYHASLVLNRTLMRIAGSKVTSIPASELPNWIPSDLKNSALIAFSQSGESKDVIIAVNEFRKRAPNDPIISITNTENSTLASISDITILTRAGREKAIAATKSYTAQLAASILLSLELAKIKGLDIQLLEGELLKLPSKMNQVISNIDVIEDIAGRIKDKIVGFVLGKGPNYPTALEAALKLRETSNLHYVGYAAREFLHGPIQLVAMGTPVIFLNWTEITEVIEKVESFGGEIIRVGDKGEIPVPYTAYELSPLLMVIPMQLLSYRLSLLRGLDPDKPEKLSKVVTE